ncbi:conserved hypothetical protein [Roseiflexus castenholzii DSM 13941]|uniref:Uncharacterized protein n=2 Tax=Roseiflexaceae TaxID=1508635 RepID=A7NMQ9_ROSCS|nr:conserved hypothetical protein [Roseiflexus castenholzii DSM 13941]
MIISGIIRAGRRKDASVSLKERKEGTMTNEELLALIEEGVENGRISPALAAFITAELLGVEAAETDYAEDRLLETVGVSA